MKKGIFSLILLYSITTLYWVLLSPYFAKNPLLSLGIMGFAMWIPGIIALIFAKREGMRMPVFTRPNRFFFFGPMLILVIGAFASALSFPFVTLRPIAIFPLLGAVVLSYLLSLTGSMLFALGEELYWRGYLWEKLKVSPVFSILLIGFFWGIWHLPFLFVIDSHSSMLGNIYPGAPFWIEFGLIFVYTILLSFLFTYFRVKGKAIMVPAAMHGMVSLGTVFAKAAYSDSTSFLVGITGLAGISVTALVCLMLKLFSSSIWKKLD